MKDKKRMLVQNEHPLFVEQVKTVVGKLRKTKFFPKSLVSFSKTTVSEAKLVAIALPNSIEKHFFRRMSKKVPIGQSFRRNEMIERIYNYLLDPSLSLFSTVFE